MASPLPSPWSEHRMIAEAIGQGVADAITSAVGTNVDLGIAASCVPEEMLAKRPVPLRAIVVRFGRPLRDVLVFISNLKDDVVRPLVEVAAAAALSSLDIPSGDDAHGAFGAFTIDDVVEYETLEQAIDDCDGLYLEASYSMELPTGELQMIIGTGLLESANCFLNGMADPFAEEARYALPGADIDDGELVLGDQIAGLGDGELALGAGTMGGELEPAELDFAGASATATSGAPAAASGGAAGGAGNGLDALDAMLAQQEAAELAAAEAVAEQHRQRMLETARSNAAAVELPSLVPENQSERWTQLLSGVEVELSAELGRADLALGDITSLIADSVLTLDQAIDEPVGVYVNGTRYATARLVVVDGEYGIEILEVVDQSQLVHALAA